MLLRLLIVISLMFTAHLRAMEVNVAVGTSQDLIDEFLRRIMGTPEEMVRVVKILHYRALMFENFVGELKSIARGLDDASWDKNLVRLINLESELYVPTEEGTKQFLNDLDDLVVNEGSELSFKHLMLLHQLRKSSLERFRVLQKKTDAFFKTTSASHPEYVYSPLSDGFRKQYAAVRAKVQADEQRLKSKLSDEILGLCDEGEGIVNRMLEILEIDRLGSRRLLQLFSNSQPLKQAYNEIYIRYKCSIRKYAMEMDVKV